MEGILRRESSAPVSPRTVGFWRRRPSPKNRRALQKGLCNGAGNVAGQWQPVDWLLVTALGESSILSGLHFSINERVCGTVVPSSVPGPHHKLKGRRPQHGEIGVNCGKYWEIRASQGVLK